MNAEAIIHISPIFYIYMGQFHWELGVNLQRAYKNPDKFLQMKVTILFVIGLLASLIVWLNTGNQGSEKPKVIQDIYDEFLSEAQKRGIHIPQRDHNWIFKFGKLNDLQAGKCSPRPFPKEIVLDSLKWRRFDMEQRRALLFHEFGHCFLARDHRNEKFPTGEFISLMDGSESEPKFEWLDPPQPDGRITVIDVLQANNKEEHENKVREWQMIFGIAGIQGTDGQSKIL